MGMSCIDMALADYYASHAGYNTRLVLHKRDSAEDDVVAATAGVDSQLVQMVGVFHVIWCGSVLSLGDAKCL
ncbi:hypothetical protein ACFX2J_016455 [Malus domestica]